jgi:ABC-2 type transport system permease protein
MPIYEQNYRAYEAREALRRLRFWPITREALRLILQRRALLGLLVVAWLPVLVRILQVYLVTRFPEVTRVLPVDGRLFGEFLNGQLLLAVLLSVFGGAGLVANDLRTGAVLVYLSRPLTRRDYVLGKLGVLLALNLAVTLAPALLLYLAALSLAPDLFFKLELAWISPAIVLHALVQSSVIGLLVLAASSLARSARVAGLALVGALLVLELVRTITWHTYRTPFATLMSVSGTLRALGNALFGVSERAVALPWPAALALLAAVAGAALLVLRARVRAVEVVA